MQSAPPPVPEHRRSQLMTLVALALVAVVAGLGGFLLGASNAQAATLHVSVTNAMPSPLTVQVFVNGQVKETVVINSGQVVSQDEHVTYATADGAYFQVSANAVGGPHDTATIFVDSPGTYPANLTLGG